MKNDYENKINIIPRIADISVIVDRKQELSCFHIRTMDLRKLQRRETKSVEKCTLSRLR